MKTLTMGSLFDGIGGFPLAAVHNGIVPVWASEIETFPIEVTRLRFPDMVHVGDITKLDGGYHLRRLSLSGFVRGRSESRNLRRTLRPFYGTGANRKGDERCG